MGHLPLAECEDGAVYRMEARNFGVGVFVKVTGSFIGIRTKFGKRFLDTEYHWDLGPPYGTARPHDKIGRVPAGIVLDEFTTREPELVCNDKLFAFLEGC